MNYLSSNEIGNWLPWRLVNHSSNALCEWIYAGNKSFTEPFFDDTVSVCRNLEENCKPYKVVTGLQMMLEWADQIYTVAPTAIIFHVSRCGSTLLSQLLSMDETNIVLSEVPIFDELLRLPFKNPPVDIVAANNLLNGAIKYYSHKRIGKERHLFIKTDSWHLHFYSQLRTLFRSVPFILLYRNPTEVILSQQRYRGMHSVPGIIEPAVFGFSNEQINEPDLDRYLANVLAGYFSKMIEIMNADPLVLAVNYGEGMSRIMKKIDAFLGLNSTNEKEKLFNERCRFHAKHPQQVFKEENKEGVTPGHLLPVLQLFRQLEELRLLKHSLK